MAEQDESLFPDLGVLLGGRRGVLDASAAGVVLVTVDAFTRLWVAIVAAVAAAALVALVRALRREPVRQAAMGLVGLAGAAALAYWSGDPKKFFLPGIVISAAYGVGALVSVLVRYPVLGFVAALLDRRYRDWRSRPALRRAAAWATLVWVGVFFTRAAVQGWLYVTGHETVLAAARLLLGLPLWAVAVTVSLLLLEGSVDTDTVPPEAQAQPASS